MGWDVTVMLVDGDRVAALPAAGRADLLYDAAVEDTDDAWVPPSGGAVLVPPEGADRRVAFAFEDGGTLHPYKIRFRAVERWETARRQGLSSGLVVCVGHGGLDGCCPSW